MNSADHLKLASGKASLTVVSERVILSGYRMYVVEEWMTTSKHHKTVVFPGTEEDKV